jgi:protein-S-isoprenylcysteine O-methyltransferase Ste14
MEPLVSTSGLAAVLFWSSLAVWVFAGRRGRRTPGERRRDRGTAIGIVCSIGLAVGLGLAAADAFPDLAITASRWPLFVGGLVVGWAGIALALWATRTLGRFYRPVVTITADHEVISTGPYRYVRHPIYAGAMLVMLGVGLALGNWLSLALCVLLPLAAYVARIRVEEAALVDALGDDYRQYEEGKPRLVPGVW